MSRMARKDMSVRMTFEQSPGRSEGTSHRDMWEQDQGGQRLRVRNMFRCLRISKEARVAAAQASMEGSRKR